MLSAGVRDASGHSCMERISFLESEGSNLRDACSRVAVEYPQACGACAPQGSPMDPAQREFLSVDTKNEGKGVKDDSELHKTTD